MRDTSPRRHRPDTGFTIVELMVAMTLMSILAMVGVAALGRQNDGRNVRYVASQLSDLIQESRARALTQSRAVIVEFTAGGTEAASLVRWFESANNLCNGVPGMADPSGEWIMDPTANSRQTRNVAIMRVEPAAGANLRLCFLPTGRIVDAGTGRPLAPLDVSGLGGRGYIELLPLTCANGACAETPYRMTLATNFNGLSEVLAPEFRLP
jgi:prepilin-type N-terminal cleavage/methylation domain-containing protein